MKITRRRLLQSAPLLLVPHSTQAADAAQPFGTDFPNLEFLTTGEWWKRGAQAAANPKKGKGKGKGKGGATPAPSMDVPREEVVCFAQYSQQNGVLKMSAQLFPLKPGEQRVARLEVKHEGEAWKEIAKCSRSNSS